MLQIKLKFLYKRFVTKFFELMLNCVRKKLYSFIIEDYVIVALKISYKFYENAVMIGGLKIVIFLKFV